MHAKIPACLLLLIPALAGCSSDSLPAEGAQATVPAIVNGQRNPAELNSAPAGYATTAVGGVLTVAGIYFWIRDASDAKSEGTRTSMIPLRGGGMVTFSGQF